MTFFFFYSNTAKLYIESLCIEPVIFQIVYAKLYEMYEVMHL